MRGEWWCCCWRQRRWEGYGGDGDESGMLCWWPTFGFAKGEERSRIQQYRKFSPIPNIWAFKLHKTATKNRQQMKKSIFFVDRSGFFGLNILKGWRHKCNDQNIKETMLQIFHNDPLVTREINSFSEPEVVFWEILFFSVLCIDVIFFWHVPLFLNFLICLSYESTYFAESIFDSPVKAYILLCTKRRCPLYQLPFPEFDNLEGNDHDD